MFLRQNDDDKTVRNYCKECDNWSKVAVEGESEANRGMGFHVDGIAEISKYLGIRGLTGMDFHVSANSTKENKDLLGLGSGSVYSGPYAQCGVSVTPCYNLFKLRKRSIGKGWVQMWAVC